MGARDSYPAGTFCWVDLATPDADAAKRFYGALFGWEAPDGPGYAHWALRGRDVAGVYARPGGAHWTSYVAVADADAVAERAADAGGSVVEAPVSVGDEGRRAVLADPLGASVALWQPGTHAGAQLVNDVGCWCSNQLQARDPAGAIGFYRDVLGWEIGQAPEGEVRSWSIRNGGRDNGGMVADDGPPEWLVYFSVEEVEVAAHAAAVAGGSVRFPPTTVGFGRIAVLADPQGAEFGVFAGRTDP